MTFHRLRIFLLCLLIPLAGAARLPAQTVDKVKLDILSALSTPLPITVIGPLLTRDVAVMAEGDSFRATLADASLMGIFPLGDISMTLTPLDGGERYRISDMTLPATLDVPGFARMTLAGVEMQGTWSTARRSYSDLHMVLRGLDIAPADGSGGRIALGSLTFDVLKEPDETDTESRFGLISRDVSIRDVLPANVTLGEARALLSANGDKPVDLYSVIREVILLGSRGDGGSGLRALAQSLLGDSYGLVSLDLAARDLDMRDRRRPDSKYLRAAAMEITTTLTDVAPRHWGGADIVATLTGIDQTESVKAGNTTIDSATLRLTGADLPVGAMFEAGQAVAMATGPGGARRPVPAALLLDGFMGFGRFGLSTEGSGLSVVQIKRYPPPSEEDKDKDRTEFTLGYDRWSARLDLSGLRDNAGTIALGADFAGGQFLPGPAFRDRDRPHVEAWFPLDLRLQSRLGGLNEGFLRTLLTDVTINRLDEPVELILPMALYFMATVFDVTSGDDLYRTGLFEYTQQGQARLYPTKMLGVVPYEGEARVTLSGIDRLNAYFAGQRVPEAASVLTVLRNLGRDTGDGRFAWDISRPDIERSELVINGTTLRYPDLLDNLPMMMGPLIYGRTRF